MFNIVPYFICGGIFESCFFERKYNIDIVYYTGEANVFVAFKFVVTDFQISLSLGTSSVD